MVTCGHWGRDCTVHRPIAEQLRPDTRAMISDCDYQESILNLMQCLDRPHRRCLLSWLEQETLYEMDQSEMSIDTADQSQLSIHLVRGDHQGQCLGPHRGVSPILVSRHYHLQQTHTIIFVTIQALRYFCFKLNKWQKFTFQKYQYDFWGKC